MSVEGDVMSAVAKVKIKSIPPVLGCEPQPGHITSVKTDHEIISAFH